MILAKVSVANLRHAFMLWRAKNSCDSLEIELNETGPQTEQVFEANRMSTNLGHFMRSQNFSEEEVRMAKQRVSEQTTHQMQWLYKRLKLGDKRLFQRMFDHWKMWIKVRRLFKWLLQRVSSRSEFAKADLQSAFDKWRRCETASKESLSR